MFYMIDMKHIMFFKKNKKKLSEFNSKLFFEGEDISLEAISENIRDRMELNKDNFLNIFSFMQSIKVYGNMKYFFLLINHG